MRFAAALGLILLLGVIIWATPPLRTIAQEVLDSLFNRSASDTQVIEYEALPTSEATISPTVAETFNSVTEAETATQIDIREPSGNMGILGLSGVTINHELQTVWLIYNAPGRYLSIYQRPAELGWLDEGTVGASAQVIPVEFTDADGVTRHGEYVEGGWLPTADATPTADGMMQEPAQWTSDTTQRRLRWQDDDLVYEMVAFGGSGDLPDRDLTQAGMVALAASMR